MKHIKLFNTDAQYQEFASNAAQPVPNVSYVTETDEVHYNESDPILFAYEYQADKFVMGVVVGSDIYVDTYETGFIVADGSGKFSTALAYTNDDLINIQNAIKDHYHLAESTIKTKAPLIEYAVGGTVPNWNAYEKIELPELIYINLQTNSGNTGSFAGFILGNKFHWYTQNNGSKIIIVSNAQYNIGTIVALIDWDESLKSNVLQAIRSNYPNVDDIETYDVTWSQGDIVPDWEIYEYIPR